MNSGSYENDLGPFLKHRALFIVVFSMLFVGWLPLLPALQFANRSGVPVLPVILVALIATAIALLAFSIRDMRKRLKNTPRTITVGADSVIGEFPSGGEGGGTRRTVLPFSRVTRIQTGARVYGFKFATVARLVPASWVMNEVVDLADGSTVPLGWVFLLTNENAERVKDAYQAWAESLHPPPGKLEGPNNLPAAVSEGLRAVLMHPEGEETTLARVRAVLALAPLSVSIDVEGITGFFPGKEGAPLVPVHLPFESVTQVWCFKKGAKVSPFSLVTTAAPSKTLVEALDRLKGNGWPPKALVLTAAFGYVADQKLRQFRGQPSLEPGQFEGEPQSLSARPFLLKRQVSSSKREQEFAVRLRGV